MLETLPGNKEPTHLYKVNKKVRLGGGSFGIVYAGVWVMT